MYSSAPVSLAYGRRSNTTSEMYINSDTLETPNREYMIKALAKSIHYTVGIHTAEKAAAVATVVNKEYEIFSEKKYPLTTKKRNFNQLPILEEMVYFVKYWFFKQVLSSQVGIMALHYIDLLIQKTDLYITTLNWRRVLLTALLISDKMWEEDIVCNADYLNDAYPLLTLEDLNGMERKFLKALEFKLLLKSSVYAEYYFELRSLSGLERVPARPLDIKTVKKLLHVKSISGPTVSKRKRTCSLIDTRNEKEKPEETFALSYEQFSRRLIDVR